MIRFLLVLLNCFMFPPGDVHFPCCCKSHITKLFNESKLLFQANRSPFSWRCCKSELSRLGKNNSISASTNWLLSELESVQPSSIIHAYTWKGMKRWRWKGEERKEGFGICFVTLPELEWTGGASSSKMGLYHCKRYFSTRRMYGRNHHKESSKKESLTAKFPLLGVNDFEFVKVHHKAISTLQLGVSHCFTEIPLEIISLLVHSQKEIESYTPPRIQANFQSMNRSRS